MNRDGLKKNMLLKKKNEKGNVSGNGDCERKENESTHIFRVLAVEAEQVLVIDCIKKTMPVWIELGKLNDFVEEKEMQESNQSGETDIDILEEYSPDIKKIIYQRYNIISTILPFVSDEAMRSGLIAKMAEEHGISKQSVRKYLCEYLASQDIRSLAPQERNTQRALTRDEKNMRKALNKYYYTTKKRTLKNVYTLMLKDSYCDTDGKLFLVYPSFYQFRYFFRKYNKKQTEYISRNGLSYYQRNQRPLVGDGVQAFAPCVGVGMLDATTLDIYLINEAGGIVGRPILTACVDAYSGLCCGYSLSWEGGTYSLRNLMLNVITDKVEHCRSFGIELQLYMAQML